MKAGSIEEVTERLKSWCILHERGLARVEWDSAYARQDVIDQLKHSLGSLGISLVEISLPPGQGSQETVAGLIENLRSQNGSVASITGIEWAFPEDGSRLDTLVALSFQRKTLASLPVRQIWWIPSHLTEQFVLGVPDLDSWFRLRLHLTEVPQQPVASVGPLETTQRKTVSVAEARSIARRFWERLERARAENFPEERIWDELAQPAVEALLSAGLQREADAILARTSDARERYQQRLQDLLETRGPEDPEVLSLTGRLGDLLAVQGDFAGARRLLEQVSEASMRVLGEEHPNTLVSMGNLALTLWAQGDSAGARRLQEQVLEASTRVLGEEHPDTLTAMGNLAGTLGEQRDQPGARRLQERVLEVSARVLGEEHPDTLRAMHNLAVLLLTAGEQEGALRLFRKCLAGRRKVLGEDHPDTITTKKLLKRLEAPSPTDQP